ncbi:hypothetical protein SC499_04410 [Peribacillus simplex]|nr:hypothetical protein [Peribacillus simplex]MDW7613979.1 hypothetical protein [Peribacillus simplex]
MNMDFLNWMQIGPPRIFMSVVEIEDMIQVLQSLDPLELGLKI